MVLLLIFNFPFSVQKHAQLSVIVVPVVCSLVAVILIVFGVAYYVQRRKRYVEKKLVLCLSFNTVTSLCSVVLVMSSKLVFGGFFLLCIFVVGMVKDPKPNCFNSYIYFCIWMIILLIFRFTVEVADFDFGQGGGDLEYKTFRERLRESVVNSFNRDFGVDGEGNVWSPSRKYGSMQ